MEDKEKPKKINTIDLSAFNKKRLKNLNITSLQYEFNAHWKCILEFLKENNFEIEIDSKCVLNDEQYEFIKSKFKNNNCKNLIINHLDIEAKIENTTVPIILEYFNRAKIKYQLSENGKDIINLDFRTWFTLQIIIIAIKTTPIENIYKYKEDYIDVDFIDYKNDFNIGEFDNYNSNYRNNDNSVSKGLYNIAMSNFFGSTWSCDLCDGDSETGCLLSDKSRCIKC